MKTISRLISSAILLALSLGLFLLGKSSPHIFLLWYPATSQWLLGLIGGLTAKIPVPLWETVAIGLAVWFVVSLVRAIGKKKILRWLSGVVHGAAIGIFLFMFLWGGNHLVPTVTERFVSVRPATVQELSAACEFFGHKADEAYLSIFPEDFENMAEKVEDGFRVYDAFPETEITIKPLLLGELYHYLNTTGIFVPMTAETCVSGDAHHSSLPFIMCHEAAHRMGAAAEEDANFCAFLACVANPDDRYRYSGWFSAFVLCYNALYEQDPAEAERVFAGLSRVVQGDIGTMNDNYARFEGKVQDTAEGVNDAYLTLLGQQGVESYGLVSDALAAWYRQNM